LQIDNLTNISQVAVLFVLVVYCYWKKKLKFYCAVNLFKAILLVKEFLMSLVST
jgi:hypothetical protein